MDPFETFRKKSYNRSFYIMRPPLLYYVSNLAHHANLQLQDATISINCCIYNRTCTVSFFLSLFSFETEFPQRNLHSVNGLVNDPILACTFQSFLQLIFGERIKQVCCFNRLVAVLVPQFFRGFIVAPIPTSSAFPVVVLRSFTIVLSFSAISPFSLA